MESCEYYCPYLSIWKSKILSLFCEIKGGGLSRVIEVLEPTRKGTKASIVTRLWKNRGE